VLAFCGQRGEAYLHVGLPAGFEDGHGGETARAHGDVGELVGGAVGVDGEEVGARGVDAAEDEGRAYLALVSISGHR
jgi:hypothetical protein